MKPKITLKTRDYFFLEENFYYATRAEEDKRSESSRTQIHPRIE